MLLGYQHLFASVCTCVCTCCVCLCSVLSNSYWVIHRCSLYCFKTNKSCKRQLLHTSAPCVLGNEWSRCYWLCVMALFYNCFRSLECKRRQTTPRGFGDAPSLGWWSSSCFLFVMFISCADALSSVKPRSKWTPWGRVGAPRPLSLSVPW